MQNNLCLLNCFLPVDGAVAGWLAELRGELARAGLDLVVLCHEVSVPVAFPVLVIPISLRGYAGPATSGTAATSVSWNRNALRLARRDRAWAGAGSEDLLPFLEGHAGCEHALGRLLTILAPAVVLTWGATLPPSLVLRARCEELGIPTFTLEHGLLPDTLMVDRCGHGAWSDLNTSLLASQFAEAPEDGTTYEQIRNYYRARRRILSPQSASRSRAEFDARYNPDHRAILTFLGQHDHAAGLYPGDDPEAALLSPFFASTADCLATLGYALEGRGDRRLLFKPHPLDGSDYATCETPGTQVLRDVSLLELFEHSDVLAFTSSASAFEALLYDKPCVLLARSPLSHKGAAYELTTLAGLGPLLDQAFACEGLESRQRRQRRLLLGICRYYLVGVRQDVPTRLRLPDLARLLAQNAAPGQPTRALDGLLDWCRNELPAPEAASAGPASLLPPTAGAGSGCLDDAAPGALIPLPRADLPGALADAARRELAVARQELCNTRGQHQELTRLRQLAEDRGETIRKLDLLCRERQTIIGMLDELCRERECTIVQLRAEAGETGPASPTTLAGPALGSSPGARLARPESPIPDAAKEQPEVVPPVGSQADPTRRGAGQIFATEVELAVDGQRLRELYGAREHPCPHPFRQLLLKPRRDLEVRFCSHHPSVSLDRQEAIYGEGLPGFDRVLNHEETLCRRRALFLEGRYTEAGCPETCDWYQRWKATGQGYRLADHLDAQNRFQLANLWLSMGPDCNVSCRYCLEPAEFQTDFRTCTPGIMPVVRDYVRRGGDLLLTGGEPFLPRWGFTRILGELVGWGDARGRISVQTNGTYLGERNRGLLLRGPLSSVGISLDTLRPELYEYLRRGTRFAHVWKNATSLVQERAARGGTLPRITLLCAVMKSTSDHLRETVERAVEAGFAISLTALGQSYYSPTFSRQEGLQNLSPAELESLHQTVIGLDRDYGPGGPVDYPSFRAHVEHLLDCARDGRAPVRALPGGGGHAPRHSWFQDVEAAEQLLVQGRFAEARLRVEPLREIAARSTRFLHVLAALEADDNRVDAVRACYDQILRLDPRDEPARRWRLTHAPINGAHAVLAPAASGTPHAA